MDSGAKSWVTVWDIGILKRARCKQIWYVADDQYCWVVIQEYDTRRKKGFYLASECWVQKKTEIGPIATLEEAMRAAETLYALGVIPKGWRKRNDE